jgi:hypothetical protein
MASRPLQKHAFAIFLAVFLISFLVPALVGATASWVPTTAFVFARWPAMEALPASAIGTGVVKTDTTTTVTASAASVTAHCRLELER